jgi:hypothetical protein
MNKEELEDYLSSIAKAADEIRTISDIVNKLVYQNSQLLLRVRQLEHEASLAKDRIDMEGK